MTKKLYEVLRRRKTVAVLAAVIAVSAIPAGYAKEVRYEPVEVRLRGAIHQEAHFGPPNFGENPDTDSKISIYVLTLPSPVDVKGDPTSELDSETVLNVREIQLIQNVSSQGQIVATECADVTGKLFHAHSAHHYKDVLLDVDTFAVCNDADTPSPTSR